MIRQINNGSIICADTIEIGKNCTIGKDVRIIVPDGFKLGAHSVIGDGFKATCRSLTLGEHVFIRSGIVVGKGGWSGPNSILSIGDKCYIGEQCIFNVSESIIIGNDVGIGEQTNFWTHGAFSPVNLSFPAKFAPIEVHNQVWIQGRSCILPGVVIEKNCIVGMGAIVTKSIPEGKFVAGVPAQIRGEAHKKLTRRILEKVAEAYRELAVYKKLNIEVHVSDEVWEFQLTYVRQGTSQAETTLFHLNTMTIEGNQNRYTEDFRDFLRRRGFKFWTDKQFSSILPPSFIPYKEWL